MKIAKILLMTVLTACLFGLLPQANSQVYSINVVGYVNLFLTNGLNFVCNPLAASDGSNDINAVLTNATPSLPDYCKVFLWNVTNQSFSAPAISQEGAWYNSGLSELAAGYLLPPGQGFVIYCPNNVQITTVGTVEQGGLTNFIAGNHKFSLLGNIPPVGGTLNAISFPGIDGADVITWNTPSQKYSDAFDYFTNYGWFDPDHVVSTSGPTINVAQSFFVQNPGPDTNWGQTFTVQAAKKPLTFQRAISRTAPGISHYGLKAKRISLQITNPDGASYDIQFSEDGSTWKTTASNLTNATWAGVIPNTKKGFFQVVSHSN